ncbi:MAG: SLC13 family permease, partial [Planctomycetia bacterium]|nr:SLC13 family permease [Planctomycetia bacterium]
GLGFIRQQVKLDGVPVDITFFEWCLVGVPIVILLYLFMFVYLNWFCPAGMKELPGGREYLLRQRNQLGPWTRGQISTLIAFLLMVTLWVAPGVIALICGETSDAYKWCKASLPEAVPAMLGAGLLFLLPGKKGEQHAYGGERDVGVSLSQPVVREQLGEVDFCGRGKSAVQFSEVGERIDAVPELAGDQRQDCGSSASALFAANEEPAATSDGQTTQRAFGSNIVESQLPVVGEAAEPVPLIQPVTDGRGHCDSRQDLERLLIEPSAELGEDSAPVLLLEGSDQRRNERALTWADATQIDWGVVLLYGGGFAFGVLAQDTGLAAALGKNMITLLPDAGSLGFLIAATLVATLVSEATSNTASANIVVPVVIAMAQAAGVDPLEPALGATFGCSLGFMLPVSTPCNAIVYGSGMVPLSRMIRYGALLDVAGAVVIVAVVRTLSNLVR